MKNQLFIKQSGDQPVSINQYQSTINELLMFLNNHFQNLIINTQVNLVKLQDTLDEMKPVFVGLEKDYADKQLYYEQEKKVTVG